MKELEDDKPKTRKKNNSSKSKINKSKSKPKSSSQNNTKLKDEISDQEMSDLKSNSPDDVYKSKTKISDTSSNKRPTRRTRVRKAVNYKET